MPRPAQPGSSLIIDLVTGVGVDGFVLGSPPAAPTLALASTLAYVASTLYTVCACSRSTGTPSWACLIVQWSDFHCIREIGLGVLQNLRWKRS